ncbi:hypothetical protein GCM10010170_104730 [Dactylosporangium salmoneum]|uniref:Uncharacterized protein n=1 Tax=Dactylosporangium salmoneum TaxID=53361 RepID=A0ABP5V188_9ACTN
MGMPSGQIGGDPGKDIGLGHAIIMRTLRAMSPHVSQCRHAATAHHLLGAYRVRSRFVGFPSIWTTTAEILAKARWMQPTSTKTHG